MWPTTTLLLPVWPRDAKRLDTPGGNDMNIEKRKKICDAIQEPSKEKALVRQTENFKTTLSHPIAP